MAKIERPKFTREALGDLTRNLCNIHGGIEPKVAGAQSVINCSTVPHCCPQRLINAFWLSKTTRLQKP